MIANSSPENMGGLSAISIALVSDITDILCFKGSCKVSYASGKSALSVYFTPNSAKITTPALNGGVFSLQCSFRSPKDRPAVLTAILPYINQKVIVIATDSNGEVKVYGSLKCPLVLNYAPTDKGLVTDYNGVAFEASGTDFAPGRFLATT